MHSETRQSAGVDPAGSQVLQEGLQDDGMPAVCNMEIEGQWAPKQITGECNPWGVRRLWGSGKARTMGLRLQ